MAKIRVDVPTAPASDKSSNELNFNKAGPGKKDRIRVTTPTPSKDENGPEVGPTTKPENPKK